MKNMTREDVLMNTIDAGELLRTMSWSDEHIKMIETEADARYIYERSESLQIEFKQCSTFLAFWLAARKGQAKIFRGIGRD